MEYFFAGTILMILLFTAIFSTISIIEDRREGFFTIRTCGTRFQDVHRVRQGAGRNRAGIWASRSIPNPGPPWPVFT